MVSDAVDPGAQSADMPPGAPEEPPAQGTLVQKLLPPAHGGDDGPNLVREHPLGTDLGIAQKLQRAVREHPDHSVQHIFHPKPGKEDHTFAAFRPILSSAALLARTFPMLESGSKLVVLC